MQYDLPRGVIYTIMPESTEPAYPIAGSHGNKIEQSPLRTSIRHAVTIAASTGRILPQ